jgi:hypothetical protein
LRILSSTGVPIVWQTTTVEGKIVRNPSEIENGILLKQNHSGTVCMYFTFFQCNNPAM